MNYIAGGSPECGPYGRHSGQWNDHLTHPSLSRDGPAMHRAAPSKRQAGERPRIKSAHDTHAADQICHFCVYDTNNPRCRLHDTEAERIGDPAYGCYRSIAVKTHAPSEKPIRVLHAQHEISVCNGRRLPAAVARRPWISACALRSDIQAS